MTNRLYHSVANKIMDLIDSGAFPAGEPVAGERDLAEKFGVSRVAVRKGGDCIAGARAFGNQSRLRRICNGSGGRGCQ